MKRKWLTKGMGLKTGRPNEIRSRRKEEAPEVDAASLLDMFTIILIFLIVSFDAEKEEFTCMTMWPCWAEDGVAIKPAALVITRMR